MEDRTILDRMQAAFDRIGGLPEPEESREYFAERVECGDALKLAFEVGMALHHMEDRDA